MSFSNDATMHDDPYDLLTRLFRINVGRILQLEFLPGSYWQNQSSNVPQLVQDGEDVGIGKAFLVRALPRARSTLLDHLGGGAHYSDDKLWASQVLLLFDPEYLTAANYRKRHLLDLASKSELYNPEESRNVLLDEMAMLNSFVMSPLHRHTKSPTLWHHRRWLLHRFYRIILDSTIPVLSEAREISYCRSELSVITKASERHPLNYYAWNYARSLFEFVDCQGHHIRDREPLVEQLVEIVYDWCTQHPEDTSGWSFLLYLLHKQSSTSRTEQGTRVVRKALDYAMSYNLDRESIWSFLRVTLASDTLLSGTDNNDLCAPIWSKLEAANVEGKESRASDGVSVPLHEPSSRTKTLPRPWSGSGDMVSMDTERKI